MENPFELLMKELRGLREEVAELRALVEAGVQKERTYYSVKDASKLIGVSAITLYRQCLAGKVPVKQIGSRKMIPGSFIDKAAA